MLSCAIPFPNTQQSQLIINNNALITMTMLSPEIFPNLRCTDLKDNDEGDPSIKPYCANADSYSFQLR